VAKVWFYRETVEKFYDEKFFIKNSSGIHPETLYWWLHKMVAIGYNGQVTTNSRQKFICLRRTD
jgi:hypothetical protein